MSHLVQIGSARPARDIPPPTAGGSSLLVDAFGRRLTYLRVSVTDRCNLRCLYCLPEGAALPANDRDFLDPERIERLVGTLVGLGIRQVRVTGGEPLVRKDILEVVRRLRALPGLEELALSTNGTELARLAGPLRDAGIDRVNVSVDTLDGERFHQLTRRDELERVWQGVEAALAAGFDPVKLNSVLLADHQPGDVDRLVDLTLERPLAVRFIEMMPTATNQHLQPGRFRSCDWVRSRVEARHGALEPADPAVRTGPARSFRVPGAAGTIGFITPLSHTFCHDCNRLRVTARGELRLCLFADRTYPLRHLLHDRPALEREVLRVLAEKPAEHMLAQGDYGNLASFMEIGG
ncbi:MAG: GTP 3',8-cyclase MoaA [Acidobacteriota bacterium]|nr:GTP 3',8-cyclase MoaA [Acidobacteriota bacterium]MDH3524212.1 GTP 3',8-cyclase MoaA [Acidobacteriota bacterium]